METKKQKLSRRKTYTPKNAPQVLGSVVLSLNREETLSEQVSKTLNNNSEVDQQQHTVVQTISGIVYVQNKKGEPLMPTTSPKARKLLQKELAKVVTRKPYTIRLLVPCRNETQTVTLGIDSGTKNIGFSAVTKKRELVCGEVKLRTNISDKLTERRMYRRNKRSKLWYRQARFLNRTRTKKAGWLAPSIQHKLDTHLRLIKKIKGLLPITNTVVEVAQFDTQKLQNIDIHGVEYQQGQMTGYNNLRAFILTRDNYTCQICKKKEGIFDIHHIIQRKDGGSNRSDNLVAVHIKCHKAFHNGKRNHVFVKPKSFKETILMNNVWSRVVDQLQCEHTYGYITKEKRLLLGLDKTHYNDAFIIANGTTQPRTNQIEFIQKRRNNRTLQIDRKGFAPSIKLQRYNIQPKDLVWINNKVYECNGSHCKGSRIMVNKKSVNINLVQKHFARGGLIC